MLIIWYLCFVFVVIILTTVAMRKLNNTNKLRSRRIKLYVVAVFFGIVLLLTIMAYQGVINLQMSWWSLLIGAGQVPIKALTDHQQSTLDGSTEFFGIMFDAGSTGSRIHVFKLQQDPTAKDGAYQLLDEFFMATKPGLSSYANDPAKAADSLRSMLDKAKQHIPSSKWSKTALGLKATAGLRLLSNKTALAILDEVSKLFQSYPFQTSSSGISILEGAEEGLFCWFTINFLKGLLQSLDKTVGILDLGGGSTQITYLPTPGVKANELIPQGYLVGVQMLGQELDIYTYSYLGLGINSVRFQCLGGRESSESMQPGSFRSVCLPNGYSGKWKYGAAEHNITSKSFNNSKSRFEACSSVAQSIVAKYNVNKPKDLNKKTFYALSYYYDRAVDVKLIDADKGGQVRVQDFINAAKNVCQQPKWTGDPFLCLDLCYIGSLLTDGFGFDLNTNFLLNKKVDDIEITWSLGALFNYYGKFNTHV